ncbi:hypothetical protein KVR01_002629 [Diaporthe batatas]|uniref:uncharacterized protein n=1 Tax=Diaporthe batatas TaxID=748121 RepID=UPI001D03F471|nr:uncharacterized protein KVR01_002629 [Diaporthe batatas]KAG8166940.1 hypothetical protein KVR01_002629 [Diaporthe batatas]
MCGIGDARNLWETLTSIVVPDMESLMNENLPKELHFTLIDLKPAALARILVMLRLMSQLPKGLKGQETSNLTWTIAYLFVGHVVPPFVHATLSKTILNLIDILERDSPKSAFLKWVIMSEDTRAQVLQHLRLWSEPLDDLYRPENIRKTTQAAMRDQGMRRMLNGLMDIDPPTPAAFEEDEAIFDEFTITPPPEAFVRLHEPQLAPILEQMRSKKQATREQAGRKLDDHINKHWRTNVTMIDLMWQTKKERNSEDGLLLDATGRGWRARSRQLERFHLENGLLDEASW